MKVINQSTELNVVDVRSLSAADFGNALSTVLTPLVDSDVKLVMFRVSVSVWLTFTYDLNVKVATRNTIFQSVV